MSQTTNTYYSIRAIATRHKIGVAVLAGFIAVHFATTWGYWFHGVGLPVLDWNTGNGAQVLPQASHNTQFLSGGIVHYLTGIGFAVLYAFAIHPLLPWRNTALGNLAKGVLFGFALAILSAIFMVPLVFYPQFDPGFFSHNLGFKMVFAIFVWHLIYGITLGTIYNPLPDDEVIESGNQLRTATTNGHIPADDAALAAVGTGVHAG